MKLNDKENEKIHKDYKRYKENRINNKKIKKEVLFKIIDYSIEEFKVGSRDWIQQTQNKLKNDGYDISQQEIKNYSKLIHKIYLEMYGEEDDVFVERIKNKLEEQMYNLESVAELEAAAKMMDRLLKLKSLYKTIVDIKVQDFKVTYDNEEQWGEENEDECNPI